MTASTNLMILSKTFKVGDAKINVKTTSETINISITLFFFIPYQIRFEYE